MVVVIVNLKLIESVCPKCGKEFVAHTANEMEMYQTNHAFVHREKRPKQKVK